MTTNDKPLQVPATATCADVAKLAGVSTAVVSYVFNNGPRNVAPKTRLKVQQAAQLLDYHPNSIAQALRTGCSKLIGVVATDFTNPFFAAINNTLETQAADNGYSTMFLTSRGDARRERECIDRLLSRNVDAIFGEFSHAHFSLTDARPVKCPIILMDYIHRESGYKYVSSDFFQASQLVASHFFDHGHRRIGMLFGEEPDMATARFRGWYQAHKERGIELGPIQQTGYTRHGGYEATLRMLDETIPPTAIFAGSDSEAIGALRAIYDRHLRVPQDIAIISMDGTDDCKYTYPTLTSIEQNTDELAHCAINAALAPTETPDLQLVPVSLHIRQSCGCQSA